MDLKGNDATTEIILIRHGETAWNAEGRAQGHLDIPLNETGLAQAAALGERFSTVAVNTIYSSDLSRAHRTARLIADSNGRSIRRDARLRERHLGVLQGLTHHDAMAQQPATWDAFKQRHPHDSLSGGETLTAFFERIVNFLAEICARHAGERVVLVTHGGVLDMAYRRATGMPLETPRHFPILNASVNVLISRGGHWQIERWGDVDHLPTTSQRAFVD